MSGGDRNVTRKVGAPGRVLPGSRILNRVLASLPGHRASFGPEAARPRRENSSGETEPWQGGRIDRQRRIAGRQEPGGPDLGGPPPRPLEALSLARKAHGILSDPAARSPGGAGRCTKKRPSQ